MTNPGPRPPGSVAPACDPSGGAPPGATPTHETELKLTLPSAEHYERLCRALPPPSRVLVQQNLFLDTADRSLSSKRWALRLRLEREEASAREVVLLALKGPSQWVLGATHRVDVETQVTPALWSQTSRDGRIPLATLVGPAAERARDLLGGDAELELLLAFENLRRVHLLTLGGATREIVLDRTSYGSGEVDFEIELELTLPGAIDDPASIRLVGELRQGLEALLEAVGVTAVPSSQGKLSRALGHAERRNR